MKVCPKCKHTEPDSSAYCTRCGTAVEFLKTEKTEYSTLTRSDNFVHPKKRKIETNTAGVVFISFVAFLVISFIFVCVVTGLTSSSTQNSISQSSSVYDISDVDFLIKKNARSNGLNIVETEYFSSSNIYLISVMPDDGFAEAALLVPYNASLAKDWQYMKTNTADCCLAFKNLFNTAGFEDVDVRVDILNDQNPNNRLLTFFNGICTYDCTEE